MSYSLYILRTSKGSLYIGQTSDLERRLREHREKKGKGSKYIRAFESFTLVYTESFETRSLAMKREAELKKYSKKMKEELVKTKKES